MNSRYFNIHQLIIFLYVALKLSLSCFAQSIDVMNSHIHGVIEAVDFNSKRMVIFSGRNRALQSIILSEKTMVTKDGRAANLLELHANLVVNITTSQDLLASSIDIITRLQEDNHGHIEDATVKSINENHDGLTNSHLILHYGFEQIIDHTVKDNSSSNRNGIVKGNLVLTNGVIGNALVFTGTGQYIQSPSLETPKEMTIACWVKNEKPTWSSYGSLISKRPSFNLGGDGGKNNMRF